MRLAANKRLTVDQIAMRWPDLYDFWIAPGDSGPHALNWADKPHRLIYDLIVLCGEAREIAEKYTTFQREMERNFYNNFKIASDPYVGDNITRITYVKRKYRAI